MAQNNVQRRKNIRRRLLVGAGFLVALFLLWAFWPRPLMADIAEARRAAMTVTVDEEARTRVRDEYVVSAPVAGRLLRVTADPGDMVEAYETVIARLAPADPAFLDERLRREAEAERDRADAAVAVARRDAERARALAAEGFLSQARLDEAELALASALAAREAARARLTTPDNAFDGEGALLVRAPVSGRVLRVIEESERVLAAGAPIVSVGDPEGDLEVLTELLSTDAVKVPPGARVIIVDWGGDGDLQGTVERVEPAGFTKISALGVEEQRVNVIIRLDSPREARAGLAHGYRVDVRIVVWEDEDALVAPSSALFRENGAWMVFAVEDGRARRRAVRVGRNNGVEAEILDGLEAGAALIEYPGDAIEDGVRITARE